MVRQQKKERASQVRVFTTSCANDCGGLCLLKAYVKDGKVIRVETDDGEEPQLRACARGRAYRQFVHAPDRLRYPMKRVGARGEGRFERISWEEALDTVSYELQRVKERYGNASILYANGSGNGTGVLHGPFPVLRFLNMFGGCTFLWGGPSAEGSVYAARVTYGTLATGHTRDDLLNSRLIILWGWNPANAIWSTNTAFQIALAKEAGIKIVCIDPRFTDTAATLAHQWIPIRPGTDAAMMIAMAYIMIKENKQDQKFLDTYTVGFDKFRDYVLGVEDGIPKTPSWAEKITGVPAPTIENLAREYATLKPAALIPGYGPGRSAYGEQYHRAASTLAAMTGNVGVHGGGAAGFERAPVGIMIGPTLPTGKNPVESSKPPLRGSLDTALRNQFRVHNCTPWAAILEGKTGGFPSDFKMLYVAASNPLNQLPDINKGVRALQALEFIVVHDLFMTATARFVDILLPISSNFEKNDLRRPWLSGAYYVYSKKLLAPLEECKTDIEICSELATRLGIKGYCDKTEEEWLREIFTISSDLSQDIPDYEAFKEKGVYKLPLKEPLISFQEQIEDPEHHPFPTPSGKIELYSQRLADLSNPKLPPIPKYIEPWEAPNDPLAQNYPLQLITIHFKTRAHSVFDNIPWLRELEPQTVWINSQDATARGIKDGDEVRVFNGRGEMLLPAKVTERIMPGVVSLGQGAWYKPDEKGIDRGGCANILTKGEHSPGGAFASNTCLVGVEKA